MGRERLFLLLLGVCIAALAGCAPRGAPAPLVNALKRLIATERFDLIHLEHVRAAALHVQVRVAHEQRRRAGREAA